MHYNVIGWAIFMHKKNYYNNDEVDKLRMKMKIFPTEENFLAKTCGFFWNYFY